MESIFQEVIKQSPMLGIIIIFWFYQRQDYKQFVDKVQEENSKREICYQNTIQNLTSNLNKIDNIEEDVKEIKESIK